MLAMVLLGSTILLKPTRLDLKCDQASIVSEGKLYFKISTQMKQKSGENSVAMC